MLSDSVALLADQIDEALLARRNRAYITVDFPTTEYAAGTSVWAISPVTGRLRRLRSVVTAATTGAGALTVELGGTPVHWPGGHRRHRGVRRRHRRIGRSRRSREAGRRGGRGIEITSDGTPSGGALRLLLEIEPDEVDGALAAYVG